MSDKPGQLTEDERKRLASLFLEAFFKLHPLAVERARKASVLVSKYPKLESRPNGMPYLSDYSYGRTDIPISYDSELGSRSLLGSALSTFSDDELQPVTALAEQLWQTPAVRKRFENDDIWYATHEAKELISAALLRYLYLHGLGELDVGKAIHLCSLYIAAIRRPELTVALVVPILLHSFETDRYRLNSEAFIVRMREPFQLARGVVSGWNSGVFKSVAESATHAFVSKNWTIATHRSSKLFGALIQPSSDTLDYIDAFFAALRTATDAVSGYAQVLFVPRHWASVGCHRWGLPAMYGSEHRRYPQSYDSTYYHKDAVRLVPNDLLPELRSRYQQVRNVNANNMKLALRRLNACVSRDDDVDAILDAIIGMELLLGDQNDSLTFKLRMRVAGLAKLTDGRFDPELAFKQMGELYATRSEIVHGSTSKKGSKRVEEKKSRYSEHRELATWYLRMVIQTILTHPRFANPSKIDNELLIGFGVQARDDEQGDLLAVFEAIENGLTS